MANTTYGISYTIPGAVGAGVVRTMSVFAATVRTVSVLIRVQMTARDGSVLKK